MKKLLSILLLLVSFGAIAQTYDQLPAGSKPYGNQPYLFNGNILMGTTALKYRLIPTKARVDSLLALKAPVSPSGAYIQANASPSQNAAINVLGNVYSETGFQTAGYGFKNNGSAFFAATRTGDLSIKYGSNQGTLLANNLTSDREYHLPDASGKLALESQIPVPEDYISSLNGSGTNTTLQSPTIVNGSINNAPIGLNFPNQGKFTTLNASTSTTLELLANKGKVNGYASLDASGKVPLTQVNDVLLGAVNYQGNYNASNNTPALLAATGNKGKYYVVTNSGTQQNLDFNSGDWIISNGIMWEKVDNNNKVASVNGRIGAVSGLAEQSSLAIGQTIGANTAGSAAKWGSFESPVQSTFLPFVLGLNGSESRYVTLADFKSNIGLNDGSTFTNSITGNAASATLWRGLDADFANGYATDSAPAWLVGVEGSTGKARPFGTGSIANMLGIQAGGETLSSVAARGNSITGGEAFISLISSNPLGKRFDIQSSSAGDFRLTNVTDNVTSLAVLGNGNVGIGTVTPQFKLDVNGDVATYGNLVVRGPNNTGFTFINGGNTNAINSNNNGLDFYTGVNQYLKRLRLESNGDANFYGNIGLPAGKGIIAGDGIITANDGILGAKIYAGSTGQITFGNGSTQVGTFLGNGNFGIGITNPSEKLDVNGSIKSIALEGIGNRSLIADANGVIKIGSLSDPSKANLDGGNTFTGNQFILGNQDLVGNQRIGGINTVDGDQTIYSNLSLKRGSTNFFGVGVDTSGLNYVGALTLTRKNLETENTIKISPSTSISQNINLTLPTESGKLALIEDLAGKANLNGGNSFTGQQIILDEDYANGVGFSTTFDGGIVTISNNNIPGITRSNIMFDGGFNYSDGVGGQNFTISRPDILTGIYKAQFRNKNITVAGIEDINEVVGGLAKLNGGNSFTGNQTINGQLTVQNPYGIASAAIVTGNLRTSNLTIESPSVVSGNNWELLARNTGSGEVGKFNGIALDMLNNGTLKLNQKSVNANYTVLATDYTVLVQGSSADITITLPSTDIGRIFIIKRVNGGSGNVSISGTSIDNSTIPKLLTEDQSGLTLQSAGAGQYYIIGKI